MRRLISRLICARCVFTTDPAKLIPFAKPETYEQHLPDLLPLLEDFASGRIRNRSLGSPLANLKWELNGSIDQLTSLNCPGVNLNWPEASRAHRANLEKFHLNHAASYVWFLQNEPRVPERVRRLWATAGLHREEFADNQHWPWQIDVARGGALKAGPRLRSGTSSSIPRSTGLPEWRIRLPWANTTSIFIPARIAGLR